MSDLRKELAEDLRRQADIQAACKKHGVTEVEIDGKKVNLAAHAIEQGWSADKAELHALRAARPAGSVGVPGGLGYAPGAPEVGEEVLEAAVFHAARHQFRLGSDDFYFSPTPDGTGRMRRVPEYLQAETQKELRTRYTDQARQYAHDLFGNARHPRYIGYMSPKVLFHTMFRARGYSGRLDLSGELGVKSMLATWHHLEPESGIQAEGASNFSISNILANVLNKFALQGYLFVEQAWRDICGIRPVNDFKPVKSINLLGDVMFKALGSVGELANASVSDQAFANQAQPYGRIITIPWTHLVNDDLGMLTGIPMKIGQGAGLALNDYFWSLWASLQSGAVVGSVPTGTNLNGDDGTSFWRTTSSSTPGSASNKNKLTGAGNALGTPGLQAAMSVFWNQIDPNGNPLGFDGAMPILLHPPTLWQTANQLLYGGVLIATGLASTTAGTVAPDKNVWQGMMKPVMSRYLENPNYGNSVVDWWVLFNSGSLPVIEVAFLNGVDTPAVLQATPDYQFDKLGISIRGTMPFGVTQQTFRGGVYVHGA